MIEFSVILGSGTYMGVPAQWPPTSIGETTPGYCGEDVIIGFTASAERIFRYAVTSDRPNSFHSHYLITSTHSLMRRRVRL
jgi:hypothetical protein